MVLDHRMVLSGVQSFCGRFLGFRRIRSEHSSRTQKSPNKFLVTHTIFYIPAFPQRGTLVVLGNESNCSLLVLQVELGYILRPTGLLGSLLDYRDRPNLRGYLSQVK